MNLLKLSDKTFRLYLTAEKIEEAVNALAEKVNAEIVGKRPVFLVVLNGSFMFASDLLKQVNSACEVSFIKIASYTGTTSKGSITELIGLKEDIKGRNLVVLEDIVDTGNTIESLLKLLEKYEPGEIKIATLLFKPNSYKKSIPINFIGISIADEFVVGYGLDYNGLGRNLKNIYKLD